jgi:hypothetical protein
MLSRLQQNRLALDGGGSYISFRPAQAELDQRARYGEREIPNASTLPDFGASEGTKKKLEELSLVCANWDRMVEVRKASLRSDQRNDGRASFLKWCYRCGPTLYGMRLMYCFCSAA